MPTKNICIFGDSIAYGSWSRNGGWPQLLGDKLRQETIDSGFQKYYFLYNLSIPGDTTNDVRKRFTVEREAYDPHITIFAIGINDASCRENKTVSRVAVEQFKQNMEALISEAKAHSDTVLVIGLTRVDERLTTPFENTYFTNEQVAAYDKTLRDTCEVSGARYLDVSDLLTPEDLADGLHPNDAGHEKLFNALHDFLRPLL